jgi:hypothetical protein
VRVSATFKMPARKLTTNKGEVKKWCLEFLCNTPLAHVTSFRYDLPPFPLLHPNNLPFLTIPDKEEVFRSQSILYVVLWKAAEEFSSGQMCSTNTDHKHGYSRLKLTLCGDSLGQLIMLNLKSQI